MNRDDTSTQTILSFNKSYWIPPAIIVSIPQGDMPGDQIEIHADSVNKANTIFPALMEELRHLVSKKYGKLVISVSGGSGVGKTTIASVLAYYLNYLGIGTYTLSGDNYPRRLPKYNDAERMHRFQEGGLLKMLQEGCCSEEYQNQLKSLRQLGKDADLELVKEHPWLSAYIRGGISALTEYLGTEEEIEYSLLNRVISDFKAGKSELWLKRMGKEDGELWFEKKDFSNIQIIILEWTHGNSDFIQGVDVPIYLNSTPEETLEFRKARNRNKNPDSPFVMRVLEIEQEKLYDQANKAKIVISRDGKMTQLRQDSEVLIVK